MRLGGRQTRRRLMKHNTMAPIISRRKPIHSFAALLWKSMRRFESTFSILFSVKRTSCPKHRIVRKPAIVSAKWWITGAFVTASRRVNSLDDKIKYPCIKKNHNFKILRLKKVTEESHVPHITNRKTEPYLASTFVFSPYLRHSCHWHKHIAHPRKSRHVFGRQIFARFPKCLFCILLWYVDRILLTYWERRNTVRRNRLWINQGYLLKIVQKWNFTTHVFKYVSVA